MSSYIDSTGVNIYNIARTIGHCTVDLGKLCTSIKVNPFSKFKPFDFDAEDFPVTISSTTFANEEAALETVHWSITGPVFTSTATLYSGTPENGAMNYTYTMPTQHYRINDFLHYFHDAQAPFMQAVGKKLVIDMLQDEPDPMLFYMFFNYQSSGVNLSNKAFSTSSGIDTDHSAVASGYVAYNMSVEELVFTDSLGGNVKQLIDENQQYYAYLGLVVYHTDSSSATVTECFNTTSLNARVIEQKTQINNEMWIIPTGSIATAFNSALGEKTAIACAKISILNDGTYYLPVYSKPSFPAKFTLDCGVGNYKVSYIGMSSSATGQYTTSLTTTSSTIYFKVQLRNYGNRAVTIYLNGGTPYNNKPDKVTLRVTISGSVTPSTTEIPTQISAWTAGHTPYKQSGDPDYFQIGAHSSGYIIYQIQNIWSLDNGTTTPSAITAGQIGVVPQLNYKNVNSSANNYATEGIMPIFQVTYGSV